MPALCKADFKAMELMHVKLFRTGTHVDGDKCDYAIYGDEERIVDAHPVYVDEKGLRRNR